MFEEDETNQVLGMESVEGDDENGSTKRKMEVKKIFVIKQLNKLKLLSRFLTPFLLVS